MSTPIYFYKAKNLSNLKADSIVAVKNDNESAFSLFITDKTGIPYPLKDLQNNVIITNTDGNLQITTSSTSTNINLASSILTTINSALQSGDNISELINDVGYLTTFTETDPIFQASEASLFVSGDKANLDNQSGVNSGNQTSIVGISGTKAQFNVELTDGDFLFAGDIIGYTNEEAQDAVGSILTNTATIDFSYDDTTPTVSANVKLNSITASQLADNINISEFINNVPYELQSNKGIANGYASLDIGGKVPVSQLPNSIMEYQGLYNASTNTPTLVNGVGNTGDVYKVSVAGLGVNSLDFKINDYAIYNGTTWEKSKSGADDVNSVFGRAGTVIAQNGDYTTALVPETTDKHYQTDNQDLFNDATSSIQTQLNSKEPNITATGLITDFWSGNKTFRDLATDVRNVILTGFNSTITWARVTTSTTIQNAISLLQQQSNYLQSTRFISGAGVTINADPTKFDIQVVGEIVNPNTFVATPINVNLTAVTATFIGTQVESYVWVNNIGTVIQSLTPPTPIDYDSIIGYWVLVHSNLTSINIVNSFPYYTDGDAVKIAQILSFIGFSKFPDTNIATAGTTGTRLTHTGGFAIRIGLGNTTKRPVASLIGATDSSNMEMRHRGGTFTTNIQNIDVTNYNPTGNTVSALSNNKFSAHKIWKFSSGLIRIQYGQFEYGSYAEAIVGIPIDTFVDEGNAFRNGLHIGWLVFKKGTSWGTGGTGVEGVDYNFLDVKNGVVGSITPTLQAAYDVSETPQITTNATKGAVDFKRGSLLDSDNVVRVLNGAGTSTLSIKGTGALTALSFIKTGGTNSDVLRGDGDAYPVSSGDVIAGLGYLPVNSLRNINTTSPILGGGNLTADRTISIQQATTSQNGYLNSTDWNTFNSKAPSSGSANYIQNQNASAQSANMWISGEVKVPSLNLESSANPSIFLNSTFNEVANRNWRIQSNRLAFGEFDLVVSPSFNTSPNTSVLNFKATGAATFASTVTASNGQLIGGTGIANYIPKWTGTGTQGNSLVFDNGTNVGIGTTTPNINNYIRALTIVANSGYAGIEVYGGSTTAGAQIDFGGSTDRFSSISGEYESATNGFFNIRTRRSGSMEDAVRITSLGNVGIGTTNPATKLDVVGNAKISSLSGTGTRTVVASSTGVLSTISDGIAGTGTTNFIPKFTSSGVLGNSIVSELSGTVSVNGNLTSTKADFGPSFTSTNVLQSFSLASTDANLFQVGMIGVSNGFTLKRISSSFQMEWDGLAIFNSAKINNLVGTGTRTVVADASGVLSATNTLSDLSLTGNPTAPTATLGTNTTQIATTAFVQATRPYKVYTALLTQTGTNAPVATILENTLGGTVVWTRSGTGSYAGTLTGVFTDLKTWTTIGGNYNSPSSFLRLKRNTLNDVSLVTESSGISDNVLENTSVEIRVYN